VLSGTFSLTACGSNKAASFVLCGLNYQFAMHRLFELPIAA
jgi:hypothetical protein